MKCTVEMVVLLFNIIAALAIPQQHGNGTITLYNGPLYTGSSINLNVTNCTNLPEDFDRKVQSLDTHGNCVNLHVEEDCRGQYYITGETIQKSVESLHWNKWPIQIRSVAPCDDLCSNIYAKELDAKHFVTIYGDSEKKLKLTFRIHGCQPLPREFNNYVAVVGRGPCVQVYSDYNCTAVRFNANVNVRKRTPTVNIGFVWDTSGLSFGSTSYCGFNCNRGPALRNYYDASAEGDANLVFVYDGPDYLGDELRLDLSHGCVNITGEWDQAAQSLRSKKCIIVYNSFGCLGSIQNYRVLNDSNVAQQMRLQTIGFDHRIRSIKSCGSTQGTTFSPESLPALDNISTPAPSSEPSTEHQAEPVGMIILYTFVGMTFVVSISVAVSLLVGRYRRANNSGGQALSEKEIMEFLHGWKNAGPSNQSAGSGIPMNPSQKLDAAYSLPLDAVYDISKDALYFDKTVVLGSGEYAVVYRGKTRPPFGTEKEVAVKTVKPNVDVEYVRALLKEIKVMIYIGKSPYVINFVGCCTQNLRNTELYVVTDICENGNVLDFIKTNASSYVNLVEKGQIFKKTLTETFAPSATNFNTIHILQWSVQIADGMAYLSSRNVIHGDLAARNVLLDADFNIKIADFGLSRKLYENTEYTKKKRAPLPWRWMAIESLKNMEFSTKSDVWAFGITLWEIFSLGDIPYPGMMWSQAFLFALSDGLRPPKPSNATSDCYNFMLACWREKAVDRISFEELRTGFKELLDLSISNSGYLDLEEACDE